MDEDPERTAVWRRPAGNGRAHAPAQDADTDRLSQPVRPGEQVVNVNRPTTEPYLAARPASAGQQAVWRAQRVIYYVAGVIEAIIAVRFVLKLIAANPSNTFTSGVYGVSWVFDFPFNGVVANINLGGGSIVEFFSLIAILVYILASIALVKLIGLAV